MNSKVTIAHGSGGKMTRALIKDVFFKYLGNDILDRCDDSAVIEIDKGRIAVTTDSFVVKPIFFPGGDIGKLAICGTVNDLAVSGAEPKYITCGFIIEEGFPVTDLEVIVRSMAKWACEANVKIVAGDTKVVEIGEADGIFINTSGVGILKHDRELGVDKISSGDKIIVSGTIGDHAIAILSKRKGLRFESTIESDCAPLNKMLTEVIESGAEVKFMRDVTRGGLATTLNEVAEDVGILINEESLPVSEPVRGATELLGLDPVYLANEGKVIILVKASDEAKVLQILKNNEYGAKAETIGEVTEENVGKVCLKTILGVTRIIDMPTAEHLPRIC